MFNISTSGLEAIINGIDMSLILIIVKLGIIYFILCMFKNILDCIIGYYQFRSDPLVSIGAKVKVDNFDGYIKKMTFSYITIVNDKYIYMIKTSTWKSKNWIFYKTNKHEE